ncbi:hypothetical protein ABKV19_015575 [Rosa sericea]
MMGENFLTSTMKVRARMLMLCLWMHAFVQREAVFVAGSEAIWDNHERVDIVGDGFMWFKRSDGVGRERSVGLSMKIVERMKWEQERVGWLAGDERKVKSGEST